MRLLSYLLLLCTVFASSCSGQKRQRIKVIQEDKSSSSTDVNSLENKLSNYDYGQRYMREHPDIVSQFIRRVYQDQSGDLWMGTNGDGVVRQTGDTLEYYSIKDGLGGVAVRAIVEDDKGDIWFATERGVSRYDREASMAASRAIFENYTEQDGLANNNTWCIAIDREGIIWIGTLQGVSKFDGETFTSFDLPESEPDRTRGVTSAKIVHSIMQDTKGQMWLSTNGGVYIYDGVSLSHLSVDDGLCGNVVNDVLEDHQGHMWFATHHNGVCKWDGTSFEQITDMDEAESWSLFEDSKGGIWYPVENHGLYRYDTTTKDDGAARVERYAREEGLPLGAIQCVYEDREGRIWAGGYLGLFRYDSDQGAPTQFYGVMQSGPWK